MSQVWTQKTLFSKISCPSKSRATLKIISKANFLDNQAHPLNPKPKFKTQKLLTQMLSRLIRKRQK